ncbi:MAG: hypothetical protein AAF939_11150 [Planctomycetota bacterium]
MSLATVVHRQCYSVVCEPSLNAPRTTSDAACQMEWIVQLAENSALETLVVQPVCLVGYEPKATADVRLRLEDVDAKLALPTADVMDRL